MLVRPTDGCTTIRHQPVQETSIVATNHNKHDGRREGAVSRRSQFQTPSGQWAKRDAGTGRIMDVKADPKPFKGVRKER